MFSATATAGKAKSLGNYCAHHVSKTPKTNLAQRSALKRWMKCHEAAGPTLALRGRMEKLVLSTDVTGVSCVGTALPGVT